VTDFPWLTTLAAVPLLGAVAVAALPKGRDLLAKQVALAVSLVPLAMTVWLGIRKLPPPTPQEVPAAM
jgi:NADH-quinone oxidoreductase subunit M